MRREGRDAYERLRTYFIVAAQAAREVAVLSPWRRRRLGIMRRYEHAAEHLELAYTNSREMVHWAVSTIRASEPVPVGLPASIEHLGEALRLLHRDFLAGQEPDLARARALQAIKVVNEACADGVEFAGTVVVSKLRVGVSELLEASGMPPTEAKHQAGLTAEKWVMYRRVAESDQRFQCRPLPVGPVEPPSHR
ncbi:hypothetical protein [Micromonospora sp. NPDC005806]|uniref:hypothetical protein n=1 Tax=Micromonospora sp. NPDC005806 TaxID=3364234 RepID=UPI0036879952